MSSTAPTNSAAGINWDLRDLYATIEDSAIDRDLSLALQRAQTFEKTYRGKIAALQPAQMDLLTHGGRRAGDPVRADGPAAHLRRLLHAASTDEPRHGALLPRARNAAHRDQQASDLLRPGMGQGRRRRAAPAARDAAAAGTLSSLPRAEARLEAALPERAGGEDPRREGRSPAAARSCGCSTRRVATMRFPFEPTGETRR